MRSYLEPQNPQISRRKFLHFHIGILLNMGYSQYQLVIAEIASINSITNPAIKRYQVILGDLFIPLIAGHLPSTGLTYPTWGKGKSSSK